MLTAQEALRAVVNKRLRAWTRYKDTRLPWAINCGYCADFRDGVFRDFSTYAALRNIEFDAIYYSDLVIDEERPRLPVGLTWDMMDKSNRELGLLNYVCHEWIRLDGLHFDSEVPDGVTDPFEVPCVRRGLVEGLATHQPEVLKRLAVHPWWQGSIRMSASFLEWYDSFFKEQASAKEVKAVIDSIAAEYRHEKQQRPQSTRRLRM